MASLKSWLMFWNTDEWWPCIIGLIAFAICAISSSQGLEAPSFLPWMSNPLLSFNNSVYIGVPCVFVFMLFFMYIFVLSTEGRAALLFPFGFLLIFLFSALSKLLAAQKYLHEYGIGDSIFAIFIGMFLCNLLDLFNHSDNNPRWIKSAQQTEAYISVSLVLLLIDINQLLQLAVRAMFVAWIDTPLLIIILPVLGIWCFKQDRSVVIITTCVACVCGSSAGIATAVALGHDKSKAQLPIAISSLLTIPAIIFLPYFASLMHLSDDVAGAWFGGCVDSTGAVLATAALYGTAETTASAAVIKMAQNVLIAPISVVIANLAIRWAKNEEASQLMCAQEDPQQQQQNPTKERSCAGYLLLLWERMPKFVLVFILSNILFNSTVPEPQRAALSSFAFTIGEWFSTCSFVSIGLNLRIRPLFKQAKQTVLIFLYYVMVQLIDIVVTLLMAWLAFLVQ